MQMNERIVALGVGERGYMFVGQMLGDVEGVVFADVKFQASYEDMMPILDRAPLTFNLLENVVDEFKEIIDEYFVNSDLIFVIGDSPLSPEVAKVAREAGKLTIGIALTFDEELKSAFKEASDVLISFDKDMAEKVVETQKVVESMVNLITKSGFVNLDFEDIKAILQDTGTAFYGIGNAKGDNRAKIAAMRSLNMCGGLNNAKRIVLNITTGREVSLSEMSDVAEIIEIACDSNAQVIWGHVIDDEMGDDLQVTFIAGMNDKK